MRVLVAEDEALVAMLIEFELRDAGFETVGPFATCAEASGWLKTEPPDGAVLDLHLKDGPCLDVAAELVRRSVLFVTLTGSEAQELPVILQSSPVIRKPSDRSRLPAKLAALIKPRFR